MALNRIIKMITPIPPHTQKNSGSGKPHMGTSDSGSIPDRRITPISIKMATIIKTGQNSSWAILENNLANAWFKFQNSILINIFSYFNKFYFLVNWLVVFQQDKFLLIEEINLKGGK
jgi:hypothetical protein